MENLTTFTCNIRSSLCTQCVRAAVVGGTPLITQSVSATITLGIPAVQTFVPAFVIVISVFTLILVDHRLVTRLGGGGHGGE